MTLRAPIHSHMLYANIVRIRFREQPQATLRAKRYTLSTTDLMYAFNDAPLWRKIVIDKERLDHSPEYRFGLTRLGLARRAAVPSVPPSAPPLKKDRSLRIGHLVNGRQVRFEYTRDMSRAINALRSESVRIEVRPSLELLEARKQRAAQADKRKRIEAALVAEATREDEETNARKRRKVDTAEVARTFLTLFSDDETAPTDTSDAGSDTATTAPPVDDDETSPLA